MSTSGYNSGSYAIYYGPNGSTAIVDTNNLTVTSPSGTTTVYVGTPATYGASITTYTNDNGGTATVVTDNGQAAIRVTDSSGNVVTYTTTSADINNYNYGYNNQTSAGAVTGPAGNTAAYATGPNGNTVAGSTANNDYNSTLPPGIPGNQILPGQEDLYILKSQVVPPVCPVCPNLVAAASSVYVADGSSFDSSKCPACPPCGRCPEQPFECKKVPNYSAVNSSYLPMPVLNDFSTFGM